MGGNKDLRRAKHEAYQKKQAAKADKVSEMDFWRIDHLGYPLHDFYNVAFSLKLEV